MRNKSILGFTISELIIVLTLLAILATISFFSFTGYSRDARDAVRITDIKNIKSSLETYYFDTGSYPNPTNSNNITYNGALVWKQGSFGDDTFQSVRVMNSMPTDPSFGNEYSYSVLNDGTQMELVGVLEGSEKITLNYNTVNAAQKKLVAQAYVTGNYNGLLTKVSTGGTDYVVILPSITTNSTGSFDLVDIVNNKKLVYNDFTNLPSTYISSKFQVSGDFDFTPSTLEVYSGSLIDLEEGYNQVYFLEDLKTAYAGTNIAEKNNFLSNLSNLEINPLLPSYKVRLIACDVINHKLNYSVECDGLNYITTILEDILEDEVISGEISNILFILPGDNISTIFRDSSGDFWFGTDEGLAYYDGTNWTVFQVENSGLISNNITSVTQSIDGHYWIGTTDGISELLPDLITWNTYTASDIGLKKDDIYYIFTSDNGSVWVGTTKGVATLTDGVWEQYTKKSDNLSTERVKVIYEDSNSNVWFGSHEMGVDKMVFVSDGVYEDELINYKPSNTPEMPSNKTTYIIEDDSNNMWFGTEDGIGRLSSDQVTWYSAFTSGNSSAGLYSDNITYIFEDTGNNFWFGTDAGVGRLASDLTTWTHYGKADSGTNKLKSDNIISIYEDDSGNILILGDEGMDTIDTSLEVNPVNP